MVNPFLSPLPGMFLHFFFLFQICINCIFCRYGKGVPLPKPVTCECFPIETNQTDNEATEHTDYTLSDSNNATEINNNTYCICDNTTESNNSQWWQEFSNCESYLTSTIDIDECLLNNNITNNETESDSTACDYINNEEWMNNYTSCDTYWNVPWWENYSDCEVLQIYLLLYFCYINYLISRCT